MVLEFLDDKILLIVAGVGLLILALVSSWFFNLLGKWAKWVLVILGLVLLLRGFLVI